MSRDFHGISSPAHGGFRYSMVPLTFFCPPDFLQASKGKGKAPAFAGSYKNRTEDEANMRNFFGRLRHYLTPRKLCRCCCLWCKYYNLCKEEIDNL